MNSYYKRPRLYTDQELKEGQRISLTQEQAHHLKNVLRLKSEDSVRLFNGEDGEWLGFTEELSKKTNTFRIETHIRPQPVSTNSVSLYFAPIKKHRQDWLIEKAVELGVTDLHIVITQNTAVRSINEKRIVTQIKEAAEQSEQMHLATLHSPISLDNFLGQKNLRPKSLYACLERCDSTKSLEEVKKDALLTRTAIMIGPEGGYTEEEKAKILAHSACIPVSLGNHVLRCETAAIKALILSS